MSPTHPSASLPLAIIGGGTMTRAIVRGGLDAGMLDARFVAICEPDLERREFFRKWGVRAVESPGDLGRWLEEIEATPRAGQILLAVKPQSLSEVGSQWAIRLDDEDHQGRVIISILAGASSASIRAAMGGRAAIVRVMPNTPASIGKGCSAVCLGAGARLGDETRAVELFAAIGRVVRIEEQMMDAFTAIAGSGPAYVFYVAEAVVRAACELGFEPSMALDIAKWTIAGSGSLLEQSEHPPAVLRSAVTSKGGTTAAATQVLDAAKVQDAFVAAIHAARDRGQDLSKSS
jgi:pyrroline-5-carboxylate reductase